jgi:hypothetical protein
MVSKQKAAWKEAAWIFGLSRLIILLISYCAVLIFPIHTNYLRSYIVIGRCSTTITCFLQSWWRWDVVHYVEVAYYGYAYDVSNSAFFPLFPLLIRDLGTLLGGSIIATYAAGLILANICFYGVLVLFYQLLYEDFGHTVAANALFYLAFAPYAIFFFAGYAESLFLLLSLAVFFFLRHGKPLDWWLAGLCGFLATFTRPTGIILLIPFLVLFIQKFGIRTLLARENWQQKLNALLSMALVPAGLLIYMFYLWIVFGNPLIFSIEQSLVWYRSIAFPWVGTFTAIRLFFQWGPAYFFQRNLSDLFFTLAPLVALIVGWKRLPFHYSLFSLVMMLFTLCYPALGSAVSRPLMAAPRYMLVVFPIFLLFALWSKQPRLAQVLMVTSLIFFAVNIMLFVTQNWVA